MVVILNFVISILFAVPIDEINDDDVTEVVEVPVENEEPVKVYVNQYANVPENFKQLLNINKVFFFGFKLNKNYFI